MRHWTLSAAIGAAIVISSAGSPSPARGVASGIYEIDRERSDDVFQAIERAIAGLPNDKRPLARMRLRKSLASGGMRISIAGSRFAIAFPERAPIVVTIGGEPVKWTLVDVLVFYVSAKADGEAISLTFRGDDIKRVATYRGVGRDLVVDSTVTSLLVSTPIVYKQVFHRTN
jgi:hypothetical protein